MPTLTLSKTSNNNIKTTIAIMANDFETILESMKDYATFRKPKYMHRDHEDAATYRDRLRGYLTDSAYVLTAMITHGRNATD